MNYNQQLLKESCEFHKIDISNEQLKRLDKYSEMLLEWNKKINLTAICEPDDISIKHFMDSIVMLGKYQIKDNAKFIDIGAGAGFPSIPLAIMRPECEFVMVDSLLKRVNFLNLVCEKLSLKAVAIHSRAEDLGKKIEFREKFDISIARAVASLRVLSELSLPFIKKDGEFIAYKGNDCDEELKLAINTIDILGGKVEKVEKFKLDILGENARALIFIKKISHTLTKYPRNNKDIANKPL